MPKNIEFPADLPELTAFVEAQDHYRSVENAGDPEEEEAAREKVDSAAFDLANYVRNLAGL